MGEAKRRRDSAAKAAATCPYHASVKDLPMPPRIAALPVDARGFPVPHFVDYVDGVPDHRVMDGRKLAPAVRDKLCWICGQPLGKTFVFSIGPMCAINRIISEPPSHRECAEYSVKACPFLSRPHAHRREAGMPENRKDSAGFMLKRNPGVTALWVTQGYRWFRTEQGNAGVLFQLGNPLEVNWYAEGRPATRAEAAHSIYTGLNLLIEAARRDKDPVVAEQELFKQVSQIPALLPAEI